LHTKILFALIYPSIKDDNFRFATSRGGLGLAIATTGVSDRYGQPISLEPRQDRAGQETRTAGHREHREKGLKFQFFLREPVISVAKAVIFAKVSNLARL
jgi:hypothetical protein